MDKEYGTNTHYCNMCGEDKYCDNLVWINSTVGLCWDCYKTIPENIKEKLECEDYDAETREWLDSHGINY